MPLKRRLRKIVDDETEVRCVSGSGIVREEVWADADGAIVRYNLAFINHFLTTQDNGRVLGYDVSHGHHHRHFKGLVEPFDFVSYSQTLDRFEQEVRALRKEKP